MLCQNCGKNEANVKYTQIVNGSKKEMVLCEDCAEKMGINTFKTNIPMNFSNFLDGFFNDYENENLLPSFIKEKSSKCDNCNELYEEFIKTGLLGCPECYTIFEDRLDKVLKNLQGNTSHIGREPINIQEKLKNIGENSKTKDNIKKEENVENRKQDKKMELELQLEQAIKEERYEDAAKIRDKIKEL